MHPNCRMSKTWCLCPQKAFYSTSFTATNPHFWFIYIHSYAQIQMWSVQSIITHDETGHPACIRSQIQKLGFGLQQVAWKISLQRDGVQTRERIMRSHPPRHASLRVFSPRLCWRLTIPPSVHLRSSLFRWALRLLVTDAVKEHRHDKLRWRNWY